MMRAMSLKEIASALEGCRTGGDLLFEGVAIDSRRTRPGELFVALRGPHHDGHDFIPQAQAAGACAVLAAHPVDTTLPEVIVGDTGAALGELGRLNRAAFPGRVVGITGSVGKTGTREMLAAILGVEGNPAVSQANFNNEIGVPLTLLELAPEHDYAVVEMGAAAPGDIRYLCSLVQPDVAVLNNVAPAHLESFGSLETVARSKGEIFQGLAPDGVGICPRDERFLPLWRECLGARSMLTFSTTDRAADLYAEGLRMDESACCSFRLHTPRGDCSVRLQAPGRHNVHNALSAAAAALALGCGLDTICRGLEAFHPLAGRLQLLPGRSGALLLDDSYNASPCALRAAIDVLAALKVRRRILVLADMAELGEQARRYHEEVGAYAREQGLNMLLSHGLLSSYAAQAFGPGGVEFSSREALRDHCREQLGADCAVLIKGSRNAGMEWLVAALRREKEG